MTLTIQDLGALGEFLGSIAVLATLVYLALQTRQNTMAIGAQLDGSRLASILNLNLAAATSTDLMRALAEDPTDQAEMRQFQQTNYWGAWLNTWQWQFIQARQGLLPTYNEPGVAFALQYFFRSWPVFGDVWDRQQSAFLPEFVEWVEEQRSKAA